MPARSREMTGSTVARRAGARRFRVARAACPPSTSGSDRRSAQEMKTFPYDDPSVGTPLRDDLQLVVLEKSLAYLRNASGDILDARAQERN